MHPYVHVPAAKILGELEPNGHRAGFDSGDPKAPYKFTTQVHIVPDVLPHSFEDFRKTIK